MFFLFFFGMGAAFVVLVAREAATQLQTWTWPKVECQVFRSFVQETDPYGRRTGDYYPHVEYGYSFTGQRYVSDRYSPRQGSFPDYGKAERAVEKYPAGSPSFCYVNPRSPVQAVLERGNLFFPLLILFPLIFVGIGVIGIYSAWRPGSLKPVLSRPLSDRAKAGSAQRFATAFFAVFTLIGLLMFCLLFLRPISRILFARHWPTVPCTVISSQVRTHSGNKGRTYSISILYQYTINGRDYKANLYDFFGGSSSGYAGKRAIVSRYHPGAPAVCYVNPSDPTDAVLERGFTPMMWIGMVPLVFVLFGSLGLVSAARRLQNKSRAGATALFTGSIPTYSDGLPEIRQGAGPLVLKSRSSPIGKLTATLLIALFWNGIISVFLVNLLKSWRSGYFEWFLGIFLIPFVLIGLGLLAAAGYFFLGLFNPRAHLKLVPGAPRLGDLVRLEWEVTGRVEALESLQLRLEGREEATYTQDRRNSIDRSVFANVEIISMTVAQEMRSGVANVTIPRDSIHSFSSPNNRIVWSIQVKGQIPRWPDLNEEFAITVLPGTNNADVS